MQQSCHLYVSKKVIYLPSISIHSFSSTGVSFCAKTNLWRTATHESTTCRKHTIKLKIEIQRIRIRESSSGSIDSCGFYLVCQSFWIQGWKNYIVNQRFYLVCQSLWTRYYKSVFSSCLSELLNQSKDVNQRVWKVKIVCPSHFLYTCL